MLSAALVSTACGDLVVTGPGGGGGEPTAGAGGTSTTGTGAIGGTGDTGGTGQGGTGAGPCESAADCKDVPGKPACKVATGECVECLENSACQLDPGGPICNLQTNECVSCLVVGDPVIDCGIGLFCDGEAGQCKYGCTGDVDCPSPANDLFCDVPSHTCVGCLADADCPAGTICSLSKCEPGCTEDHACPAGQSCCSGACRDLAADEDHCGTCDLACVGINAEPFCQGGSCVVGPCLGPFEDCDEDPVNGCEHNTLTDGTCLCSPGEEQPCYLGTPGTQGVGPCQGGVRTCLPSGIGYGLCSGQILPQPEICANGADDNCDGLIDNIPDLDGDGYTYCEGDCDDSNKDVNPGAQELTYTLQDLDDNPNTPPVPVPGGNGIDDDCDPSTPDEIAPAACSTIEKLGGVTAQDLAKALDLCRPAEESPPKAQTTWGLLSAEFRRTDGAVPDASTLAAMQDQQSAVLAGFGAAESGGACDGSGAPANVPFEGPTMAVLSTGRARAPGHADHVPPQPGTVIGTPSACRADYLSKHGGQIPSIGGCLGSCPSGDECFDGVSLRLRVRAPTNTPSFSFRMQAFSAEYPERLCSPYNDAFLGLVTSSAPGYPVDKNASYDVMGNPLTVNSVFFQSCVPSGACFQCQQGTAALSCTGFQGDAGASTGWLLTEAPVVPGEIITLDLDVFDVSDAQNDTTVLLDAFRFSPKIPYVWGDH